MKKRIFIIAVLCVAVSFFVPVCPAYTKRGFHCDYTGSIKSWTEWPLGIKTGEAYQQSKLEQFVATQFPTELRHKWISFQGTGFDVFGRPMLFAHGRPGPLYQAHSFLDKWCEVTSEQEKKALYDVLLRGDESQTQGVADKMWNRMEDGF